MSWLNLGEPAMDSSSRVTHRARESPAVVDQPTEGVFRCEGDFWTVIYEGATVRLRDAKGLRYVAYLLAHAGEPVPATLLGGGMPADQDAIERARVAVTKCIKASIRHIAAHHAALGYHLMTTIKTGKQCAYEPDPHHPVPWAT